MCLPFGQFNENIYSYSFLYQDVAYFDWFKEGNHVRNDEIERFRAIIIWKRLPIYAQHAQLIKIWKNFQRGQINKYPLVTRVFLKHLRYPKEYPIFDKYVWNAMRKLRQDVVQRTPENSQKAQDGHYENEYMPFFNQLYTDNKDNIVCPQIDGVCEEIVKRRVFDRALWEYGRLLNNGQQILHKRS